MWDEQIALLLKNILAAKTEQEVVKLSSQLLEEVEDIAITAYIRGRQANAKSGAVIAIATFN